MVQKLYSEEYFCSPQQNIALEPRVPQYAFPEHTHDFFEIVLVTHGQGRHVLNGRPYQLHPGVIYYIQAQDHHLYEAVNELHLTNILFRSPQHFQFLHNIQSLLPTSPFDQYGHWCINQYYYQQVQQLLEQLAQCQPQQQAQRESLFLQILIELQRSRYQECGSGNEQQKTQQLMQYLQQNLQLTIDWSLLAEDFAIPLRTLHRHLKQITGLSPQRYLNKLRLDEAYYQIRHSDKLITAIAYDCGFSDSAYFSTCFKQEFQITPRQLRTLT